MRVAPGRYVDWSGIESFRQVSLSHGAGDIVSATAAIPCKLQPSFRSPALVIIGGKVSQLRGSGIVTKKKDLFDDSVMTFGEHLEALRFHLIRALIGLAIAVMITMLCGEVIIKIIRQPIDNALSGYRERVEDKVTDDVQGFDFFGTVWGTLKAQFVVPSSAPRDKAAAAKSPTQPEMQRSLSLALPAYDLLNQLHELDPQTYPVPSEELKGKLVKLEAQSDDVGRMRTALRKIDNPVTLNVQEAFMTYIKVALISGLVLASPWIFYQMWLFVAAGLYPHERKYVYTYLPVSIFLFLGGAVFCFYAVFPWVLGFLLGFNERIELTPQIRISEWINFAVLLPVGFGLSFQLPLVMLFLQKISIFRVEDYREKRRLAILVIAFLSMVLTPAEPMSMILMMVPLTLLYELGILMCDWTREDVQGEAPLPA